VNTIPTAPTSGHVILCGLNELGFQTLEELCRLGEEVVVVARASREEFAAGAKALGVTLLEGSYRQEQVLRTAGVQTAAALVVTEDDDVGNVHAALVAHDLNPRLRIRLRMFNQELGRRVQLLFRDCQVLDAAAMAVPAFVSAALHRDRQQRLQVNGRPAGRRVLLVARLRVGDGSQAAGVTVAGFEEATQGRVLALAEGGQQRWCPAGDTSLIAGEELTVVVTRQGLAEALSHIEAPEKAAPEGGTPQPAPKFTPAP
jgi:Trk K+ transport system NAD-binding subunit